MTAGLPGTGIGSLFYVLLTVWMPFRELVAVAQGRSSWARWRFIAWQWGMLASIIVSIYLFWDLLNWAYDAAAIWLTRGHYHQDVPTRTMALVGALGGFITLTFVLTAVFVTRAIVLARKRGPAIQSASRPIADLQATLAPAGALREPVSSSV